MVNVNVSGVLTGRTVVNGAELMNRSRATGLVKREPSSSQRQNIKIFKSPEKVFQESRSRA